MFPIYMYVKEYKGLKDFEITFDNNYEIKYNREKDTLSINKKFESTNNDIENFYSIYKTKGNIDSVNLLIGKNGSGKTSILEILNMNYFEKKKRKSYFDKLEIEINYMILYKSSKDDKNFIFEEQYIAKKFTKRKEIEEIRIEEEIYESQDNGNYIENTGVLKFSFKEKTMNAVMREAKFEQENRGETRTSIYKLNIGLENGSKGKIYNYLVNANKGENFENSYLTLQIPNLYEAEKITEIKEKIIDVNSNERIDDFIRLYDINKNNLKNTILSNYFNFIYSEIIWRNLRENSKTKKELKERKKELLKLLNNESSVYRKFEILLEEYENSINNIIKFNKEKYGIIEKVADLIDNIVSKIESANEMDIENNDEIIRKFKISCKEENKEVLELLKEYDDFHIPKIEEKKRYLIDFGNSLFKEVEFIKIEEEGLSDGEKIKLGYFSTLYSILNGEFKNKKYVTLLFDEVETYLHPEWSRRFLYELIEELGRYKDKKFKLIFATHSPFLIADVLAKDCIYLEKENGKIEAKIHNDLKTFGANIIDLFKNTMFLESTFGKFATEKIKGVVDKIEKAEKYSDIKHEVDFIIDEIGEKLISNKLKSMIESKFENKDEEYYRKKIEEYQSKLEKLGNKENNKNS